MGEAILLHIPWWASAYLRIKAMQDMHGLALVRPVVHERMAECSNLLDPCLQCVLPLSYSYSSCHILDQLQGTTRPMKQQQLASAACTHAVLGTGHPFVHVMAPRGDSLAWQHRQLMLLP